MSIPGSFSWPSADRQYKHPEEKPDEAYEAARAVFDERELVDLTIAISLMNTNSRMAISFGNTPQAALEQ